MSWGLECQKLRMVQYFASVEMFMVDTLWEGALELSFSKKIYSQLIFVGLDLNGGEMSGQYIFHLEWFHQGLQLDQ